ncbi:MAG: EsaB/YukD family protein [Fastidiosipilaceae bacterium]|jgi:uncharacterized ubiquitin-like protein YukD|nr:hypothetical protein [Clostridiaceae bacterium]
MENTATVIFKIHRRDIIVDLEIPLDLTANDLILALNAAYDLQIDTTDINHCYLKAEHPIALLRGSKTLAEYGIRNGTIISHTE